MTHLGTTFGSRGVKGWVLVSIAAAAASTMASACRPREEKPAPAETTAAEVPLPTVSAPFPTPPVLPGTPDVPALVAHVRPAVVNITSTTEEVRRGPERMFEFFFGPRSQGGGDEVLKRRSLGSGFLIDAAGHVVTNAHVVAGATSVRVKLADGRELPAKIRGTDGRLDVAVLELEGAKDAPFAALGSSEALRVGEYVVAIGNPFGLGDTVTMGIVSAKGRELGAGPYDDFVQTDASINPGNSGGPLFNLRGQVIGINAVMAAEGKGIGFAIPIDAVKEVLPQLLATGRVQRGRLGVTIQQVDEALAKALGLPKAEGALINEVEPGGPAARAGLEAGDVIIAVDKTPIEQAHDLPRTIARHKPNTKVTLDVISKAKGHRVVTATLDELKDVEKPAQQMDLPFGAPNVGPGNPNVGPGNPNVGRGGKGQNQKEEPRREWGVTLLDDPRAGGVVVRDVDGNGLASGYLQPGDVIVEVDGMSVKNAETTADAMRKQQGTVLLKVRRNGRTRFVAIGRT
jgi:serine protease Do